jgi:hypothetical protein
VRRLLPILLVVLAAAPAARGAVEAGVDEAPDRETVTLRNWFVGVQAVGGGRDTYDVFGRPGYPPAPVDGDGSGLGFHFGRRFGGRFLLGAQLTVLQHALVGAPEDYIDTEFLITGTVLYRERATLQPFLRGGFGGSGNLIKYPDDASTFALGTAVVAGGGLQVRLSSRFSLELEAVATFANLLKVMDYPEDAPEEEWHIRRSQVGGRFGVGVMVWF